MRIGLARDIDDFSIVDVDLPRLGAKDVRVEVGASGICASDHSALVGHLPFPLPLALGHELAGTVVEIGVGVDRVRIGDRVIGTSKPSCGVCWWCRRDMPYICERTPQHWTTPRYELSKDVTAAAFCGVGSFAEIATLHENSVVPIETDLPDTQLALIGCGVITGAGAVFNTARVRPGDEVAVVGCGGVGMAMIQAAVIAGAVRVVAVDPIAAKRESALALGATDVIDPASTDAIDAVKTLTHGRGVDVSLEAVGSAKTITAAFQMARRGGTVVAAGASDPVETLGITCWDMVSSGKKFSGTLAGDAVADRDFPLLVRHAEAGRFNLSAFVSKTITLDAAAIIYAFDDSESVRTVVQP